MNKTLGLALAGAVALALAPSLLALEDAVWEQVNHNVRMMRHPDGTRTEYRRSNDEKTLTKRKVSEVKGGKNAILTTTVYRMDSNGNPLKCQILDGKGNLLFTVSYGYHKTTGRLVAEDMFDARTPKFDKAGKEVPIRRIYWFYDEGGNATMPISFVFREGKRAEDAFAKEIVIPDLDTKELKDYEKEDGEAETTYPFDSPFHPKLENAAKPQPDQILDGEAPPLPPLPGERTR